MCLHFPNLSGRHGEKNYFIQQLVSALMSPALSGPPAAIFAFKFQFGSLSVPLVTTQTSLKRANMRMLHLEGMGHSLGST